MEVEKFVKIKPIIKAHGFAHVAYLDCSTIEVLEDVRGMCESNSCGQYGKNWSCPPGCGTISECREKIVAYIWGVLVQTVGGIEDSMDIESMMKIEEVHKNSFLKTAEELRKHYPDMLSLGAGCCTWCSACTYPGEACRFPHKRISSMEAYGILVNDLCKKNNMTYYYGSDKIAYTSCYLLERKY